MAIRISTLLPHTRTRAAVACTHTRVQPDTYAPPQTSSCRAYIVAPIPRGRRRYRFGRRANIYAYIYIYTLPYKRPYRIRIIIIIIIVINHRARTYTRPSGRDWRSAPNSFVISCTHIRAIGMCVRRQTDVCRIRSHTISDKFPKRFFKHFELRFSTAPAAGFPDA
jgi:hypothetical protein